MTRSRYEQQGMTQRTGWPPGLLQDDDRRLSKWLASKPDAKRHAREAVQKIIERRNMYGIPGTDHAPLSEDKSEIGTFRGLVFAVLGGFAVFMVIGLLVAWLAPFIKAWLS